MWSHPASKWILREFDVSRIRPRLAWVTSPWNVDMAKFDLSWEGYLMWQTGLPTLKGDPTYHVNVIKLKWEIIWTGGLPHLSGLPGAIHSTKIPTGPTGKRGPPQQVDPFFRNFSGWTEPIHWVLDRNFRKVWLNGSRPPFLPGVPLLHVNRP